jgi:hypothetical protein
MAAPTFVQEAETAWNSASFPKGSGNFTTSTGDVVVACSVKEAETDDLSQTGTNVTLTVQQTIDVTAYTEVEVSAGVVASGGTTSVSFVNNPGGGMWFGGNALTFRDSDGIGASNKTNTTGTPSLSLTTTQANSAIVVVIGDYAAVDGTSRTWLTVNSITPSSGNGYEVTYFRDSVHYGVYIAYYPDVGAAGSKTVGLSAPGSQTYSIVALEIKGIASGVTPRMSLLGVG